MSCQRAALPSRLSPDRAPGFGALATDSEPGPIGDSWIRHSDGAESNWWGERGEGTARREPSTFERSKIRQEDDPSMAFVLHTDDTRAEAPTRLLPGTTETSAAPNTSRADSAGPSTANTSSRALSGTRAADGSGNGALDNRSDRADRTRSANDRGQVSSHRHQRAHERSEPAQPDIVIRIGRIDIRTAAGRSGRRYPSGASVSDSAASLGAYLNGEQGRSTR